MIEVGLHGFLEVGFPGMVEPAAQRITPDSRWCTPAAVNSAVRKGKDSKTSQICHNLILQAIPQLTTTPLRRCDLDKSLRCPSGNPHFHCQRTPGTTRSLHP
jgi:hypothetical protein